MGSSGDGFDSEAVRLREEHDAIRTVMGWIEAEMERELREGGRVEGNGPLLGPLRSFRDHLLEHFRTEERGNVLVEPLKGSFAPSELHDEHAALADRLDTLIEELERARSDGRPADDHFGQRLKALFRDLQRHDARETGILLRPERARESDQDTNEPTAQGDKKP